ncbi:GDP-L-fucose synthase [Tamlana sp. s12]|uniref:GDP-L-fucose synthase family protein n=1 Tax=Tamlana sp. s12 TaxID=1630406 RepID=UPI0007FCB23C|nr:GDP-L-fucose synthase [Tamlana sp. s12]OBQ55581.1 GDP-L-fucose synthase [Tamlana sp. s12]QQY83742.1 GDP-L-fucose synthase [Tamlana sp. s12]
MTKTSKIYIAGHRGMVGSAIWCALEAEGYTNLIGKTSKELDLRNQHSVNDFISTEKPDVIIDAAAKVGGILANSQYQFEFLLENMQIQNNLIDAAHKQDVSKFIFLGSSCIYPKLAPQPLKEDYLLTGPLEPTNDGYAIAKISGVRLCKAIRDQYGKDFVSLMPTNLYGPYDNFDLKSSHALPAMIRKFHEAKNVNGQEPSKVNSQQSTVTLWGSGTPMREFLHVNDLAKAVIYAVENKLPEHLYNVGTGTDVTIKTLAETIQKIVGHQGQIIWDTNKPDGTPRKLMDVSKMNNLGWKAAINLEDGIRDTYEWFLENEDSFKEVKM